LGGGGRGVLGGLIGEVAGGVAFVAAGDPETEGDEDDDGRGEASGDGRGNGEGGFALAGGGLVGRALDRLAEPAVGVSAAGDELAEFIVAGCRGRGGGGAAAVVEGSGGALVVLGGGAAGAAAGVTDAGEGLDGAAVLAASDTAGDGV